MIEFFRLSPRHLLLVAIATMWAPTALASPVTLVAQTRELEVFGSSDNPNWEGYVEAGDSDSASDFGPFTGDITASGSQSQVSSYSVARQTSTISPDSVLVAGYCSTDASLILPEGTSASVSASSLFELRFSVTDSTSYEVIGDAAAWNTPSITVVLESGGTALVDISVTGSSESFRSNGVLGPGEYVFRLRASGDCFTDSWRDCLGAADFDFALRFGSARVPTEATSIGALKSRFK